MAEKQEKTKYRVHLTPDERQELKQLVQYGRTAGWKLQRAQALLKCDESEEGEAWSDQQAAEAFGMTTRSMANWRKQAVENGPMSLLERKSPDRHWQRKLDGQGEARLTQLACSKPPEGRECWTLRLLADKLVELEVVDSITYECVRRNLKKNDKAMAS